MAVFTRLVRLVRADMHGVMDQLEDKGLLLRQHLREMEASVQGKQARLAELEEARERIGAQQERGRAELADLEADLALALAKDKDDLGRMLIRKLLPLRAQAEARDARLADLESEGQRLSSTLDGQLERLEAARERVRQALRAEQEQRRAREQDLSWLPESDAGQEEALVELELLKRKERLGQEAPKQGRAS